MCLWVVCEYYFDWLFNKYNILNNYIAKLGRFWHATDTVMMRVESFIKQRIPEIINVELDIGKSKIIDDNRLNTGDSDGPKKLFWFWLQRMNFCLIALVIDIWKCLLSSSGYRGVIYKCSLFFLTKLILQYQWRRFIHWQPEYLTL